MFSAAWNFTLSAQLEYLGGGPDEKNTQTSFSRLNIDWSLAGSRGYGDAASDLHTLVLLCVVNFSSQVDLLSYPINDRSTAGQSSRA